MDEGDELGRAEVGGLVAAVAIKHAQHRACGAPLWVVLLLLLALLLLALLLLALLLLALLLPHSIGSPQTQQAVAWGGRGLQHLVCIRAGWRGGGGQEGCAGGGGCVVMQGRARHGRAHICVDGGPCCTAPPAAAVLLLLVLLLS